MFRKPLQGRVQYVARNLLLLVTSALDLPLRTNKFSSLFSSVYSLMRAVSVKQTCTVTVIYTAARNTVYYC